jgi:DNA polymerase-4
MKRQALPYNYAAPLTMHIDLNSCFAIIEQQANRLLRGRPVGVSAYDTPRGFVLAASYEAKRLGVKLGVNVRQAREMCPGIIIVTPDPSKYREAHQRFKRLMLQYTSDVAPKSIDEFALDLRGSPAIRAGKTMEEIGLEIKQGVRERLGEWVTVNVGIGPNRFLAKFAAGFNKPDGMTRIDATNLEKIYDGMDLIDLPGINVRYRRRLRMFGINTPLEFLQADLHVLQKVVFQSIVGYHWYLRLRGWEVDKYESKRGSIGHQYALPHKTQDKQELARLLVKMCEKVGRRLRRNGLTARGIHLYLSFVRHDPAQAPRDNGFIGGEPLESGRSWHHGEKLGYQLYGTDSIYLAAKHLLDQAQIWADVSGMAITVFELEPVDPEQLSLFDVNIEAMKAEDRREYRSLAAQRRLSDALDAVNDRYGEFIVTPATMMGMQGEILDRIAFGQVRDLFN